LGDDTQRIKGIWKFARFQQHNLAPKDMSSFYPSMVLLCLPQGVREVGIHFVWAWGRWETIPTKKPTRKLGIILFFIFLGHVRVLH
jgi:hypothetical protein